MLKLYRLHSESASYDDLADAVIWAESPEDAQALLLKWREDYGYGGDLGYGSLAPPYVATEVKPERKVVLTHVLYG